MGESDVGPQEGRLEAGCPGVKPGGELTPLSSPPVCAVYLTYQEEQHPSSGPSDKQTSFSTDLLWTISVGFIPVNQSDRWLYHPQAADAVQTVSYFI